MKYIKCEIIGRNILKICFFFIEQRIRSNCTESAFRFFNGV